MNIPRSVLSMALLAAAPALLAQTSVLIEADRDNSLYEDINGDFSNGSGPALYTGRSGVGLRRALLRFDVASAVPANAQVVDVQLQLHVELAGPAGQPSDSFSLHRVGAAWGEGTSIAMLPGGLGVASTPGDATWIHAFYPSTVWATPGGDFAGVPSVSFAMPAAGFVTIPASPGLLSDVNDWLATPADNHGWLLKSTSENQSSNLRARRLTSREGTPGMTPKLVVSYTFPGVTTLAGTGCTPTPLPLTASGSASIGNTFAATPSPVFGLGLVVVGAIPINLPLSFLFGGTCSCTMVPELTLLAAGSYALPIPNNNSLIGAQLTAQGVYLVSGTSFPCSFDPTLTFALSDAIELTIQP